MNRDLWKMYADAERPIRRRKLIRNFLGLALLALSFLALSFMFGDPLP